MRPSAFRAIHERKTVAVICFGILCVMIVAAFWPFNPYPPNHVTWMSGENGVQFNGGGILLSSKRFQFPNSQTQLGASLEIWLEPSQDEYSTALLSFSSPANPEQFRLRQSHDFLLIVQEPFATIRHTSARWLWVPHVFQAHKHRYIAISCDAQGTTVYLDGVPATHSSNFRIVPKDFSGELIVGSSPVAYDTWRGKLFGLALFGRELTPTQVSEHYRAWLNGRTEAVKNDQPAALYTFAERSGSIAQNQVGSGAELAIPGSFRIPYKPLLKAPWNEFYPNLAFFREVFINVAGFIPFGFFLCMLFSLGHPSPKTVVQTIILGTLFSLTIEFLQWYIPTRDSGTTDILTNTLGTALGAMLYRGLALEVLLRRLKFKTSREADPYHP